MSAENTKDQKRLDVRNNFMRIQYDFQFVLTMLLLIILLSLSYTAQAQEPDIPSFYTDIIYSIPDLCQTDKKANFPGGGSQFCCLVSIANSLMWLDSNGFPKLVKNSGNSFEKQVELVKLLSSERYMDTSLVDGTGTTKLMRGIKKYIRDRGYEIERLEYEGWRKHPPEMKTRFPVPRLGWIKHGILGNGAVWLNVGWYKYNSSKEEHVRIAGHWVTLVGYGKDENGKLSQNCLILHDPSPRAGKTFSNEYAIVNEIRTGTLVGKWIGLPRSAIGYYKLGGGMHIKNEADVAIIDGAITLKFKNASNSPGLSDLVRSPRDNNTSIDAGEAKKQLSEAKLMLKGPKKNLEGAQNILHRLANEKPSSLDEKDLCYIYVYLGYIQDLSGNRELALPWYRQACELDAPNIEGIRQVAEIGIRKPITWIRHLDEGTKPAKRSSSKKDVIERIGRGLVLHDEPKEAGPPEMHLSKEERLESFDVLTEAIDKHFSFFVHKNIDWEAIIARYRPMVERARTTKEFYHLIYQLIRELKDFHSWLCNYKDVPSLGRFSPQISTRMIEKKLVVTDVANDSEAYKNGLRRGSVIAAIDGMSVEAKINKIRPLMRIYSSERCFLEQAYRRILDGERGSTVSIKFIQSSGSRVKIARIKRTTRKREEIIQPNVHVNKGKFIWYGKHPSGYGYIRILSFKGRLEIADEFDTALERLRNTPGLIIDIRENPGGFGTAQARIIGRFITTRTKVDIGYRKNGPGHGDFKKSETYFEPMIRWQYTKPIALLINPITGSACDLFACRMISTHRPITVGTGTHGNLTGVGVYVQLPCNLVVRVSNGYVCDATDRIIEGNGNIPQIQVEPTILDVINGNDSVIERAVEELQLRQNDGNNAN
jgi:C-terminal processing protease CtpA/Prc